MHLRTPKWLSSWQKNACTLDVMSSTIYLNLSFEGVIWAWPRMHQMPERIGDISWSKTLKWSQLCLLASLGSKSSTRWNVGVKSIHNSACVTTLAFVPESRNNSMESLLTNYCKIGLQSQQVLGCWSTCN